MATHSYDVALTWTGETSDYRSYSREHEVVANGVRLPLSADAAFRGDAALPNPEALLVAAASSCQLLSFLAVAARAGVVVLSYEDDADGVMPEDVTPVHLTRITLRPHVRVRGGDASHVEALLRQAHDECYIANSLRTVVAIEPSIEVVP